MNMNSRQMRMAMQKMGVKQQELDAQRVIIETSDKKIIFDQPQVSKINMMGNASYQVVGEYREESIDSTPDITDEDVQTVVDQTGSDKEAAKKAIEESDGDLAQAIVKLSDNNE